MALHEALLALQTGCSGLLTLKQDDPYFKKRLRTVPHVHQGELEILDRLTQLGRHYRSLDEYVQNILKTKTSTLNFLLCSSSHRLSRCRWFVHTQFRLRTSFHSSIVPSLSQPVGNRMSARHVIDPVASLDFLDRLFASLSGTRLIDSHASIDGLSWLSDSRRYPSMHLGRQYDSLVDHEETPVRLPSNSHQTSNIDSHTRPSLRRVRRVLHRLEQQHQRRRHGLDHTKRLSTHLHRRQSIALARSRSARHTAGKKNQPRSFSFTTVFLIFRHPQATPPWHHRPTVNTS